MVKAFIQPQINIPKADEKAVVNIPSGMLGDIKEEFQKINQVIFGINLVVVLALVAIIVSIVGIFLDQLRFNNAAYREYSEKIQTLNSLQDSNKQLLEQNKQNQEVIIKQQNQIIELFNRK